MGSINKTDKRKYTKDAHHNWMASLSYEIGNPIMNLRIAASSCFFGEPMYYHRGGADKIDGRERKAHLSADHLAHLTEMLGTLTPSKWLNMGPAQMLETAIDAALDHDVEETLQEAVRLRTEENIRTTPQVILVRAAHHKDARGTGLIRRYAAEIVKRAD
jgi:hypothetical protein